MSRILSFDDSSVKHQLDGCYNQILSYWLIPCILGLSVILRTWFEQVLQRDIFNSSGVQGLLKSSSVIFQVSSSL
jgi:hypothetical protein